MSQAEYSIEAEYSLLVSEHFSRLMDTGGPALARQVLPDPREFRHNGKNDPLKEERYSPFPGLIHRYPDRVLLILTSSCFSHCRFCTRKRNWNTPVSVSFPNLREYLRTHPKIKEAILSGGDPLCLSDTDLKKIIQEIKGISSLSVYRLASRALTFHPERITQTLLDILKPLRPLYFMTHFNHPDELSESACEKALMIQKQGIMILNQSVLLKSINDSPEVLAQLHNKLISTGIKPYALHSIDPSQGTKHFKVPVYKGKKILSRLRQTESGISLPHYVLDRSGGRGKIFLYPFNFFWKKTPDPDILSS